MSSINARTFNLLARLVGLLVLATGSLWAQGSTPTRFNLFNYNDLKQISTPSGNPNSGFIRVYAKTASTFCMKDYVGTETCFSAGGAGGVTSLDSLTGAVTMAIGTTGTAPNWTHATTIDTLHIPLAATAGVTAGLISKSEFDIFNGKQDALGFTPENSANKNAASGYAGLNASKKLDATQIPTLVSNLQSSDADFTVVDYPDTQFYAAGSGGGTLQMWKDQTIWTVNNQVGWNIVAVNHTGDVVDTANATQFTAMNGDASYGFVQLDNAAIPYTLAPGNHDYTSSWTRDLTGTGKWNATFPDTRYSGAAWYLGSYPSGSVESMAIKFDVGSSKYGILSLGLCPSDAMLTWAQGILNLDTARKFIISTHLFTMPAGSLATTSDTDACENYLSSGFNQPLAIWTNFIQANDGQIIMVLNGHFFQSASGPNGEATAYDLQVGSNGHIVPMVLTNFQGYTNGGSGYMRIFKFRPSLGLIEVKTYSPNLTTYLTDSTNQYNLPFGEVLSKAALTSTVGGLSVGGRLRTSDADTHLGETFHFYTGTAKDAKRLASFRASVGGDLIINSAYGLYLNYDKGPSGVYFGTGTSDYKARIPSTGVFTSLVATGTAPLSIASTTPVANLAATPTTYNAAGTQQVNTHLVWGTCTLGTSCDITLAGSAVFTSNTSYDCWPRDATTPANAVTVTRTSGSALAFTGTGTDVVNYFCVGN